MIDRENVDETRFGFEAAKAAVAKAEADVGVAERGSQVAQKAHDYAWTRCCSTPRFVAPFDGVVTQRNVNDGDFVQPVVGRKGEALFVVEQVDPVRVFVNVPEVEAVWVRDGAAASVRSQSRPGQEFQGTVTRTARSLNPTTRTLAHRGRLCRTPRGSCRPACTSTSRSRVEHRDVWTLPASAVVTEEERELLLPAGERQGRPHPPPAPAETRRRRGPEKTVETGQARRGDSVGGLHRGRGGHHQ